MSTSVIYKNFFNTEITYQQSLQLSQYSEESFIDGRLKKVTKMYENIVEYIYIYVYPDEDLNAILSTLNNPDFIYTIAKDYEIINGYTLWKYYDYHNGVLDSEYSVEVFDSEGRDIAYVGYNANNTIRWGGMKKYYLEGKVLYDDEGEVDIKYNEDSYIIFDFTDGSLKIDVVFDVNDPYSSVNKFVEDWQDLLPFMTPEILAYFTNPESLVPNVTI